MDAGMLISGAVLAGGHSRRMGSDKALLELDGETLLARAVRVLHACCDEVFVVGWQRPGLDLGVPFVPDEIPDAGPLAGIATALRHAMHPRCVVVACDMPRLSAPVIRAMIEEPSTADVVVPWTRVVGRHGPDGSYAPLHAIYAQACLPVIDAHLARDQRRVVELFQDVSVMKLDEDWLALHDPSGEALLNVNDPRAWSAVRQAAERGSQAGA